MAIVKLDNHSRAHIQSVIAAQANLHTCTWLHLYSGSLHSSGIPAPPAIVQLPPFTFSSSSSESSVNCFFSLAIISSINAFALVFFANVSSYVVIPWVADAFQFKFMLVGARAIATNVKGFSSSCHQFEILVREFGELFVLFSHDFKN